MTPGVCLNFEDLAQNTGSVDANDSHPSPPAKTSAKTTTLKRFAEVSIKGEDIVGQCIDIFHKNPQQWRKLLSDANNLPHQTTIEFGGENLDFLVTALTNKEGEYIGPMLSWSVVTEKIRKDKKISLAWHGCSTACQ